MTVLVGRFKAAPYGPAALGNRTSSPLPAEIQKLGQLNHAAADANAAKVELVLYRAMLQARHDVDERHLAILVDNHDAGTLSANVGALWAARIATAVQPYVHQVVVGAAKTASTSFLRKQASYEAETERIKANALKPAAKEPHRFKAAAWTHPNGHPRCLICGHEQPIGGKCNMPASWYRDSPEAQAELSLMSIDVKYPALAKADDTPSVGLAFDLLNPRGLEAAKTLTADLVREVTNETKAAIREVMGYSFENGLAPRQAAKLIQQSVGLTNRQASTLMKYRDSLKGQPKMSPARLDARTDTQASRMLRRRANLIARTETIRASAAGQQALWLSASDRGLFSREEVQRKWIVTHDSRLDKKGLCRHLDGALAPLEGNFESPEAGAVQYPPLHPACRCTVGLVFVSPQKQLNPPTLPEGLPGTEPWAPSEQSLARRHAIDQENQRAYTRGDPKNAQDRTRMDRDETVAELAKMSGLDPSKIHQYISDWNMSSHEGRSLTMHKAISEKFGIKMPDYLQKKFEKSIYSRELAETRKFVDSVYDLTQKKLKELGITSLHVTRGMSFAEGKLPTAFKDIAAGKEKALMVDANPLSSWSFDKQQAEGFAGKTATLNGVRTHTGVMLTAEVPAEDVYGLWWSGAGTYDEQEIVVLGGKQKVGVRQTDLSAIQTYSDPDLYNTLMKPKLKPPAGAKKPKPKVA